MYPQTVKKINSFKNFLAFIAFIDYTFKYLGTMSLCHNGFTNFSFWANINFFLTLTLVGNRFPMFSLIYRSKAAKGLPNKEIHDLMQNASRLNAECGITGCLVYHRHNFIHLLEGEETLVRKLFGRISKDERHDEIVLLNLEENRFRLFSQFSTIYNNFDDVSD